MVGLERSSTCLLSLSLSPQCRASKTNCVYVQKGKWKKAPQPAPLPHGVLPLAALVAKGDSWKWPSLLQIQFCPLFPRPKGSWETCRILEALFESNSVERVTGWCLFHGNREVVTGSQKAVLVKTQNHEVKSTVSGAGLPGFQFCLWHLPSILTTLAKSLYLPTPLSSHL